MQTFNYASKNKEVQATALKCANAESMVNQWSIYDAYVTKDTTTDIGEGVENSGKDMEMDALPGLELGSGGPDAASASAIGDSSMLNMVGVGGSDFSSGTVGPHGAYATDEAASDTTHSSVAQGNEGSLAPPSGLAASSHMMEGGPDKSAYEKELALSSVSLGEGVEFGTLCFSYNLRFAPRKHS